MTGLEKLQEFALALPEASEEPHFEKISFRVRKKIFVTFSRENGRATVKLTEMDQSIFCAANKSIYPVPNKWGKQGWTIVEVQAVGPALLKAVVETAYCQVAPKKLAQQVLPGDHA